MKYTVKASDGSEYNVLAIGYTEKEGFINFYKYLGPSNHNTVNFASFYHPIALTEEVNEVGSNRCRSAQALRRS